MAGIQLTGLASGLDTGAIIDRLMATERGPRDRMALQQAALQARQHVLGDISAKLKALGDAAQRLSSTATWQDVQIIASSDPAKVGARQISGAAPGGYSVAVTELAIADQHTYAYTPQPEATTLTISATTVSVPANATVDAVIAAINADASTGVMALGVDVAGTGAKALVLVARSTGTTAAFTASGDSIVEDDSRARPGRDALYSIDGRPSLRSSSNVVAHAIAGVELTLSAAPVSATVTIGAPAVDKPAIIAAAQGVVGAYNAAVEALRSAVGERPVAAPRSASEAAKGALYGDHALKAILDGLRSAVGQDLGGARLADIGISTGAATGGASDAGALAGKLGIDTAALSTLIDQKPDAVRRALAGDGLGSVVQTTLRPYTGSGGLLDSRSAAATSGLRDLATRLGDLDDRLARREGLLRRQFSSMETALHRARAQNQDIALRLSSRW